MRSIKILAIAIIALFLLPAAGTAAWWASIDRPSSWRNADWSASGVLPDPNDIDGPAVFLMAARTGGLKGAFSVHCWIVIKRSANAGYDRYDKVGWGLPVRKNAYAPDGRWYSNTPWIVGFLKGSKAVAAVRKAEAAIASYPYSHRGDYTIWPGPNSNSFAAHVLRSIPEMGVQMPPNAVGRDFAPGFAAIDISDDWTDVHATLGGLAGFAAGVHSGIEVHLFGLVAGIGVSPFTLKVPAFGDVSIMPL